VIGSNGCFASIRSDLALGDLARLLGSRKRASEILGRKWPFTMAMVHELCREQEIPADARTR
jgi:HTH-type transcriptional regulator/antitoxin HigA